MGLLLSTLVFCVGVVELITFYHNVRRNVEYRQAPGSLSHIRNGYMQELRNTRRKLIEDIERLKEPPPNKTYRNINQVQNFPDNRCVPTFRLNSHEDIEIEYNENIVRSKSPSPRRFLVTEKEEQQSPDSRRHFVVTEETQAIRKSKSQSSLPEYLIREEKNSKKSPNSPRYVLQEHQGTGEHPIPLPKQFIVSETELNTVVFQESDNKVDSRNSTEYVRRSPSPFPNDELPQNHRNSLCGELTDGSSLSSVQEEQKSRSPSPNTVIENTSYKSGPVGAVSNISLTAAERQRSKSESESVISNNQDVLDLQPRTSLFTVESYQSKIEHDLEEALEETSSKYGNTSGNPTKYSETVGISRDSNSRKTIKRKNVSNNELETDNDTAKSLDCAETSVNAAFGTAEKKKEPEAFWVKSVE